MLLQEALDTSKMNQVLRKIDGENDSGRWKPAATRPYFDGKYPYSSYILAFSSTEFFIANYSDKATNQVFPIPAEDSWQLLGKQDWGAKMTLEDALKVSIVVRTLDKTYIWPFAEAKQEVDNGYFVAYSSKRIFFQGVNYYNCEFYPSYLTEIDDNKWEPV